MTALSLTVLMDSSSMNSKYSLTCLYVGACNALFQLGSSLAISRAYSPKGGKPGGGFAVLKGCIASIDLPLSGYDMLSSGLRRSMVSSTKTLMAGPLSGAL
jgi:hypothetical protein